MLGYRAEEVARKRNWLIVTSDTFPSSVEDCAYKSPFLAHVCTQHMKPHISSTGTVLCKVGRVKCECLMMKSPKLFFKC